MLTHRALEDALLVPRCLRHNASKQHLRSALGAFRSDCVGLQTCHAHAPKYQAGALPHSQPPINIPDTRPREISSLATNPALMVLPRPTSSARSVTGSRPQKVIRFVI
jgi:hypothetical protein